MGCQFFSTDSDFTRVGGFVGGGGVGNGSREIPEYLGSGKKCGREVQQRSCSRITRKIGERGHRCRLSGEGRAEMERDSKDMKGRRVLICQFRDREMGRGGGEES